MPVVTCSSHACVLFIHPGLLILFHSFCLASRCSLQLTLVHTSSLFVDAKPSGGGHGLPDRATVLPQTIPTALGQARSAATLQAPSI